MEPTEESDGETDAASDGCLVNMCETGGDDCDAAPVLHVLADRVGVVAAVGQQHAGGRAVRPHQGPIAAIVGDLTAGDLDGYGQTRAVRPEMDLGRQATSRTAKTLILNPPLAPAAQ